MATSTEVLNEDRADTEARYGKDEMVHLHLAQFGDSYRREALLYNPHTSTATLRVLMATTIFTDFGEKLLRNHPNYPKS